MKAIPRPPPALAVFAIALLWLGALAWLRPLLLPDEGRYAGVAWEMLRSQDWITPTLDGLPFLHKPPLFYWLTALSLDAFGVNPWAARGASLLAAATTAAVLHGTLRDWSGERVALCATGALATQPLFYGGAQFANLDMLVAACISVCILMGARAARRLEAGQAWRGALTAAWVAAALGILAKGLIGVVLPALTLLIWLGLARRWRTMLALCWWPGPLLMALIIAPWFIAVQSRHPDFLYYFFVVQHFKRFTGAGFNSVQPFWFYVPVLLVGTLPWSAWLRSGRPVPTHAGPALPSIGALMWTWIGVVVVFFSLPQSKLIGYVLPALVPVAVLAGSTAAALTGASARAARWGWGSLALGAVLCLAFTVQVAVNHPKSSRELARQLATHRRPGEGLAFIDDYRYDVPFYLHDATAPVVVANWDPADVARHDDWRKELADAGGFAPALAQDRLVDTAHFRSQVCSGRIGWVIANLAQAQHHPFLAADNLVAREDDRGLWHLDPRAPRTAAALGCRAEAAR